VRIGTPKKHTQRKTYRQDGHRVRARYTGVLTPEKIELQESLALSVDEDMEDILIAILCTSCKMERKD
jgi:hypothetical protein